VQWTET